MELLQLREKEIFATLKAIKNQQFIIIGGYAVNAYTLPRFSVDCDLVVKDHSAAKEIGRQLISLGYSEAKAKLPYVSPFIRYEKTIAPNFKVSMDILIDEVRDRQTEAKFGYQWIFDNSAVKILKGKTILEELKVRIIHLDALIVLKAISCRSTDIRDIFMLMPLAESKDWINAEISKRYDFGNRMGKIKEKISSEKFKDDLQGVYGYIEEMVFEKHKNSFFLM